MLQVMIMTTAMVADRGEGGRCRGRDGRAAGAAESGHHTCFTLESVIASGLAQSDLLRGEGKPV